ncbi:MAG: hypothetical protein GU343_01020 [Nanoarchaeota archaeon]|jgi:hypothetical protein|nr:hypothetical protein [Nanoarchaeota archaeon]
MSELDYIKNLGNSLRETIQNVRKMINDEESTKIDGKNFEEILLEIPYIGLDLILHMIFKDIYYMAKKYGIEPLSLKSHLEQSLEKEYSFSGLLNFLGKDGRSVIKCNINRDYSGDHLKCFKENEELPFIISSSSKEGMSSNISLLKLLEEDKKYTLSDYLKYIQVLLSFIYLMLSRNSSKYKIIIDAKLVPAENTQINPQIYINGDNNIIKITYTNTATSINTTLL